MKQHIETLNFMLTEGQQKLIDMDQPDIQRALRAAIELMRSAEPKDEAAEREHCYAAVKALGWYDDRAQTEQLRSFAGLVERERAAVRAELAALKREHERLREAAEREHCRNSAEAAHPEHECWKWNVEQLMRERAAVRAPLQALIAAAEARILSMERSHTRTALALDRVEKDLRETHEWRRALQAELSAAQAEIARLKKAFDGMREDRDRRISAQYATIEQLTNLRNAAERASRMSMDPDACLLLDEAVEASR